MLDIKIVTFMAWLSNTVSNPTISVTSCHVIEVPVDGISIGNRIY
jgi:hypothetical protein